MGNQDVIAIIIELDDRVSGVRGGELISPMIQNILSSLKSISRDAMVLSGVVLFGSWQ